MGKTTIDTIIGLSTLYGEWPWNHEKLHFKHAKPRKVRYVGQDWEKHIQAVVIPTLKDWWPSMRRLGPTKDGPKKNTQGIAALWLDEKTGSTLEIMSNKQESELHEGWEGDLIIYDEPPTRAIRVANARGLIDREGRELFAMTLLKEAWIHKEVIKAKNPDGTPDTSVFNVHGDIYCNLGYGLTQAGIDQFSKTLTDEEKEARLLGIPSYMSGIIYPTFSRKQHLVKRFQIPLDWIVDIAIDIHPREKQAVMFMATDPRNERYIFHEIWDHGDGTWVGEAIIRVIKANALRVGSIIVDPLAKGDKNNPNTTFDKIDAVLCNHGYVLDTATKDRESGIIQVKNHLVGPNNKPSIFFFDDLRVTIDEIENYMWDEEKQKPQDKDDHFCENLYRLLLLNTRWYEIEEEEDYEQKAVGGSKWTGY